MRFDLDDIRAQVYEFWTADGYLWTHDGTRIWGEGVLTWYRYERAHPELVDLGGEA